MSEYWVSRWICLFNNRRQLRTVYLEFLYVERISEILQISKYRNCLTYRDACLEFPRNAHIVQIVSSIPVPSSRMPLCLVRLIILSRRLDVTRIFIATYSIFSPEWRGTRSNFTRAAPTPLRHPSPDPRSSHLPASSLSRSGPPYVSRADPSDRTNFHEITWHRACERDERNRLIITFDRNYGNETANYKKGLQAASSEGGGDFLMTRLRYNDRDNDYARHLSYDFRDS